MVESLINIRKEEFLGLLSPELMNSCPESEHIHLEPEKRTIFIGLGGSGVKTLDRLKGELMHRAAPGWQNVTAFLAIDSGWNELENASYLTREECICAWRYGVNVRMNTSALYPPAVKRFMPDDPVQIAPSYPYEKGRLTDKFLIHDQEPGSLGVDKGIVDRLQFCMANMDPLPPGGNAYQVYVIAGLGGSFGSGTITELPALIRRAMEGRSCVIDAVAYLPEMMAGMNPRDAARLRANAYATLKELNYYQGLSNRDGFPETFGFNQPTSPEFQLTSRQGFFNRICLMDAPGIPNPRCPEEARDKAVEYLVAELTGKWFWPMTPLHFNRSSLNPDLEEYGSAHEFPQSYAALGVGEAWVSEDLLRAVALGKICRDAGLKSSVSEDCLNAAPGKPVPFRGEDQFYNAKEGTAIAQQLLAPFEKIHAVINNGKFDLHENLGLLPGAVTWDEIKAGKFDDASIRAQCDFIVGQRSSMESAEQYIGDAFMAFKANVQTFVQQHGPFAFASVFYGRFEPVDGDFGMGIGAMLQNLVNNRRMDGRPLPDCGVEKANYRLKTIRCEIAATRRPLIDIRGIIQMQVDTWIDAFNGLLRARINERRRNEALGRDGILAKQILEPAGELAHKICIFGNLLSEITDLYGIYADRASVFSDFRELAEGNVQVNAAAFDSAAHQWFLEQADQIARGCNLQRFRDQLVNDFFTEPNAWLDIPEGLIVSRYGDGVSLKNWDMPIPARKKFDSLVNATLNLHVQVSIEDLFETMAHRGIPYQNTASALVNKLCRKSEFYFNGTVKPLASRRVLEYPASLDAKPWIVNELRNAALAEGLSWADVVPTADEATLQMVNAAARLEVYRISNLKDWQWEYEQRYYGPPLHGKSPDVVCEIGPNGVRSYREGQSWVDYPSIVYCPEPEKPDQITGEISCEGRNLRRLREEIEEARKMGVLYSEQDVSGRWSIWCVNCPPCREWHFDLMLWNVNLERGMLPDGRALAEEIARQNEVPLEKIVCAVRLEDAGIFSESTATEKMAWNNAVRVLRAHHPLMIQIRRTMELFRGWMEALETTIRERREKYRPPMMVNLMKANILYRSPDGAWYWRQEDGRERRITYYSERAMMFLSAKERRQISNGLLSYWLFKKVDAAMPGEILEQENQRACRLINGWISNDDLEALHSGAECADLVESERQKLIAKGARTGDEDCAMAFVNAMRDLEPDPEELRKIERFYYLTGVQ